MLVECVVAFKDIDCGVLREVGDRFEVSSERLGRINGTKYGELAREVTEVPSEASEGTPEASAAKTRARRPRKSANKG